MNKVKVISAHANARWSKLTLKRTTAHDIINMSSTRPYTIAFQLVTLMHIAMYKCNGQMLTNALIKKSKITIYFKNNVSNTFWKGRYQGEDFDFHS